jgi:type IV pilus assembly protein PilN
MPRINLLPWREQQRTERKKSFAVGMVAALVGAVVVTAVGFFLFNQLISSQQARNERLRQEITVLDKQIEQINDLEQQKQQFIARMQIIEKLQRSRPEIVHVFDTFVKTVPDGTYLTAISQNDQRFKIQGVAQSSTRVSSFMRALEDSEWLKDTELEVVESKRENTFGSDFTLLANQVTSLNKDEEAGAKPGAKKPATQRSKS